MKKKKGFTLVELLIVMTIVVILVLMMIGGINFIANVDKAGDADRKSDLNRIKISFEDYFNDMGCYPNQGVVEELMEADNCGSSGVFDPWLEPWVCDVDNEPYKVVVENTSCPSWFMVVTDLRNENDAGIGICGIGGCPIWGTDPVERANYGVSSDNILWYSHEVNCNTGCFVLTEADQCNSFGGHCVDNCYSNGSCHPFCAVSSCGD